MLQSYHLVLQKWLKISPPCIDHCLELLAYANKYNFHRYLDSECVTFIIFAFLVVFSSI